MLLGDKEEVPVKVGKFRDGDKFPLRWASDKAKRFDEGKTGLEQSFELCLITGGSWLSIMLSDLDDEISESDNMDEAGDGIKELEDVGGEIEGDSELDFEHELESEELGER